MFWTNYAVVRMKCLFGRTYLEEFLSTVPVTFNIDNFFTLAHTHKQNPFKTVLILSHQNSSFSFKKTQFAHLSLQALRGRGRAATPPLWGVSQQRGAFGVVGHGREVAAVHVPQLPV